MNGVRLSASDITATNGTSVVLATAATFGDVVDIIKFESAGPQGTTGTQGTQGIEGSFGGATFYYTFEANTTNANPGSGDLRLDNSTQECCNRYLHL